MYPAFVVVVFFFFFYLNLKAIMDLPVMTMAPCAVTPVWNYANVF